MTPSLPNSTQQLAFEADILAIRRRVLSALGPADLAHLRKIEGWGRIGTLIGVLTAWIFPNPLSILGLSLGRSTRWLLMHHVSHRGYDQVPGVPRRLTSKHYARGWRRWLDWADWILPEAWAYEHNVLHHSHTGQTLDPDLLERNSESLRTGNLPLGLRRLVIIGLALSWRAVYYAPKTLTVLPPSKSARETLRRLWLSCYLPAIAFHFVAFPLLFLPLGKWAVLSVFINSVLADVLTSVHTFIVVGPNHTGDDLYRFDTPPANRAEHYFRQVVGSTNYRVGGDLNDWAHLWLNYQIEHHLFPDIPMLRYREVQPEVRALCARYGIPYTQESVWKRLAKLFDIATGRTSMKRWVSSETTIKATG